MDITRDYDRKLILEDGEEYFGYGFGGNAERVCELVFNTGMVAYQEILSDSSYTDQAVLMTYPLIGGYGITEEDYEMPTPTLGALIVGEYNDRPSNFRCVKTLAEVLEENNIPGIEGFDTRRLCRSIRDKGSRRVLITGIDTTVEEGLEIIKNTPVSHDAVSRVSCKKRWYGRTPDHLYNVVVIDCGVRPSFVRGLRDRGCNVTIVPYNTDAKTVLSMKPDGVFISNGPGDPKDVPEVVETIKALRGRLPIFGVDLGHLLIALAYGASVYKLPFGHRGGNHPVKNLQDGKIESVTQSHSYTVCADSVAKTHLTVTHINLLDNTVEGLACVSDRVFSVQYQPNSAPGKHDGSYLYDQFLAWMKEEKTNA